MSGYLFAAWLGGLFPSFAFFGLAREIHVVRKLSTTATVLASLVWPISFGIGIAMTVHQVRTKGKPKVVLFETSYTDLGRMN